MQMDLATHIMTNGVDDAISVSEIVPLAKYEPPFVVQLRQDRHAKKSSSLDSASPLSDDLHELFMDFAQLDTNPDLITRVLAAYGVVVVTGVLPKCFCDDTTRRIGEVIQSMSHGVSLDDLTTWKPENMLPQTTSGAFLRGIGNTEPVWKVRADSRVRRVYSCVYGTDKLVSTIEMVTWKPCAEPYHDPDAPDWAHTDNPNMFEQCVQGQVVLTQTTAGFVCSPKSHLVCSQLLGFRRKHNINKDVDDRLKARQMVEKVGGKFQVPIIAPAGSVIIWLSSTLHSAKMADRPTIPHIPSELDPWYGYRCVVYLSFKPRVIVSAEELLKLKEVFLHNGTTRHDGTLFPPTPLESVQEKTDIVYHPRIAEIYTKYVVDGEYLPPGLIPRLTPEIAHLLGDSFSAEEIEDYSKHLG